MRNANCTPVIRPLDAALCYAQHGWAVFPCHAVLPNSGGCTCGDEQCASPAAHSVIAGGAAAASTDLEVIRFWWERWPRANVAVCTGEASDLVVIKHELQTSRSDDAKQCLPLTLTAIGPETLQFYFHYSFLEQALTDTSAASVSSDGSFVIAPPSLHPNGSLYTWLATN